MPSSRRSSPPPIATELEGRLSASIARIRAGDFRPTPSAFACSGCPALDVVCAGPRLDGGSFAPGARIRVGGVAGWLGATSREARRSRARDPARADPADHRAAREEHADAEIALHFGSDVELLISVMLSAQTTDVNVNRVTEKAVRQVPEARGLPRRTAGGARAGHLPDRLLPAEDEVDPRRDAHAAGGVRRRGSPDDPRAVAAAGRRPQDGERRRSRAGGGAGHRRRHPRSPDLAAARADAGGRSGQDRARSRQDRAAGRLAPLPTSRDLARPTGVRRAQAALRDLRARRALSFAPRQPGVGDPAAG